MKYKKSKFNSLLHKDEKLREKFETEKKVGKDDKLKYMVKKRIPFWFKLLVGLVSLIFIFVAAFCYFFGGFKTDTNFDKSDEALGLTSNKQEDSRVINIAVFGLDKRKGEMSGRSDAIMVVSLDGVHERIKVASILRDTRLPIDGHGLDKLGHAFSYGGANLAVKTLNKNFSVEEGKSLCIRHYIALNFSQMIHIVNAFGGVDVKLRNDEVDKINGIINSTKEYRMAPRVAKFKEKYKVVHLDGAQALSYARIRKDDVEYNRAGRQQIILDMLFRKISVMSSPQLLAVLRRLMPFMETSLSLKDFANMLPILLKIKSKDEKDGSRLVKYIIPDINDPNVKQGTVNGVWYWRYNIKDYAMKLHNFIYEDEQSSNYNLQ